MKESLAWWVVKYGYPPDKQREAIKLVMEQMSIAPRFAEARALPY